MTNLPMYSICAVVVTFNRKELLLECLDALLKQTYALNKIYLIDNNSSDGTYEILHGNGYLEHPQIVYEKLSENLGGAGGFSRGLQKGPVHLHRGLFGQDFDHQTFVVRGQMLDDDTPP